MATLYVSDLDGTLLDTIHHASPQVVEMVNELVAAGMLFTVATGRSVGPARTALTGMDLRLPGIFMNGAVIVAPGSDRLLVKNVVPPAVAPEVAGALTARDLNPLVYTMDAAGQHHVYYTGIRNRVERLYITTGTEMGGDRFRRVTDLEAAFAEDVLCVAAIDTHDRLAPAYEQPIPGVLAHFGRDLSVDGYDWLEYVHPNATKGRAIRLVAEMVGADRVVCFGDHLNDVSMFEAADESYAVANAHADVIALATGVIGANVDQGVAHHLRELWAARPLS